MPIKDVARTRIGTRVPSSGSTVCHVQNLLSIISL